MAAYANTNQPSTPPCRRRNALRVLASIGARSRRAATSSAVGGGKDFSSHANPINGGVNSNPATAGIQRSATPHAMTCAPTDFANPSARMKLAHNPATRASVMRRPSRKPSTSPNTIPKGRPLRKRHATFHGRGSTPANTKAPSANPTRPSKAATRFPGGRPDTNPIPTNLDNAYPNVCAVTRLAFRPAPIPSPSQLPAAKGFRKPYMHA